MGDFSFFEFITILYITFSLGLMAHWSWNIVSARKARLNAFKLMSSLSLGDDIAKPDPASLKRHLDQLLSGKNGNLDEFTIAISAAYFLRENHQIPAIIFDAELNSLAPDSLKFISEIQERVFSAQNLRRLISVEDCPDSEMKYLSGRLSQNLQKLLQRRRSAYSTG
jgi:hypothetical protein